MFESCLPVVYTFCQLKDNFLVAEVIPPNFACTHGKIYVLIEGNFILLQNVYDQKLSVCLISKSSA